MNALSPLAKTAHVALNCLDLTSLNDRDDDDAISALCARAVSPFGHVAAVCVWPRFVAHARKLIPATIRVAAVANFPDGSLDQERALRDSMMIVEAGGQEVDLVLPYRALIDGELRGCVELVKTVRRAIPQSTLKLIIESGELKSHELIQTACELGLDEGVEFLKTSTGKTAIGATPEAARVMLQTISRHSRGQTVGFKASGGIRQVEDAATYMELVNQTLGAAALVPARMRFGASSLLDHIEAVLSGQVATSTTQASVY